MLDLTVIILTFNEQNHIERCIKSVKPIASRIVVIDSESTDNTGHLAESLGAEVFVHPWPGNQAAQFNWALDNTGISTEWILRLDADEYPSAELTDELLRRLPAMNKDISAAMLPLRNVWMGHPLKYGGSKISILRLFRNGKGRYENRMMDEHIQIESGRIIEFNYPFVDDNLNNLNWWTNKHVGYATREAAELLDIEFNLSDSHDSNHLYSLSPEARHRRLRKLKYARQPLFWRSFAYFIYRYFLKGGFREGKEGFLRHFLQGWWYRTLVDAKIFEIKKKGNNNPLAIKQILLDEYGIRF